MRDLPRGAVSRWPVGQRCWGDPAGLPVSGVGGSRKACTGCREAVGTWVGRPGGSDLCRVRDICRVWYYQVVSLGFAWRQT